MQKSVSCLIAVVFFVFAAWTGAAAQQERFDEKEMRQWADRGDPDAQFELGVRLVTGEGVKKSEKQGVDFIQKAAAQNHLRAQHVLGSLYEEGVGVKQDTAKAVEWYRKAAGNGFAMSQHSLGILYDTGKGVTKDAKESAQWFRMAANQDFPPAQAAYANKLERGDGVEKSTVKAAGWYLRAAKTGFVPAMTKLAYMYYTGTGVPLDYRRTQAWYRRAARAGEPWATNDLAWFLSTCPDSAFHDGDTALTLAKAAVKAISEDTGEQRHEMLDTLAAAMARSGDFLGAVLWQKKAITLLAEDKEVKDSEREKLDKEFSDRLKLYQKEEAFTEKEPKAEEGTAPLPGDTILQEEGEPPQQKKPKPGAKPKSSGGSVVSLVRVAVGQPPA
ncbi:MAG: sel1 repeat family protein [Verrucomicrobiaceae bacterium]|nr:sel1 repeat family protein [Verrucomicrobiaceae bacterium]